MVQPIPIPKNESWPLDRFKPDERELARHDDPEAILRLGDDMAARGQLQPVGALANGPLIFGHGRWLAALKKGILYLSVNVYPADLTETQVRLIRASENLHRKDLTGWQKFTLCSELLCGNPSWEMQDLAKALNQDPSNITRIMSPLKCSQAWQDALRDGKVSISDCYAASKLPQDKQAGLLALKLSGATRDQLERVARKERKGRVETVKLSRVRCPLSTGVVVTVQGPEMGLEGLIETLQAALEAARKANKESLDVRTFEKILKDKAKVAG
jgi:ParB/RepB/Spo0J family partition protein